MDRCNEQTNRRKYMQSHLPDEKIFRCTICYKQVSYDDSYSNRGYNLICESCVKKMAEHLGQSIATIIDMLQQHGLRVELQLGMKKETRHE